MLTELKLSNFRGFSDEVTLRLRPITVLIGWNSAGKSSLIKFLLMLQQSLDPTSIHFLNPEGERVHLGTFRDQRNSLTRKRSLRFSLSIETPHLPAPIERQMIEEAQKAKPAIESTGKTAEVRFFMEQIDTSKVLASEIGRFSITGRVLYGQKGQTGKHEVVGALDDKELFRLTSTNFNETRLLRFSPTTASDPAAYLRVLLLDRYLAPLRYEIHSWRHLSPVRQESERAIIVASPPTDDVGQKGEYALPHLQSLLDEDGDRAQFLREQIESVVGIERIQFTSAMGGYLAHARAINKLTGAESYLSEFGFGASQCIPIFVQGAITPPDHMMMVEQPEAQLHPTAQISMGSFFADLWLKRRVASIIETHSGNLLLRLRRLVANPDHPLTAKDISIAYVHIDQRRIPTITNLDLDEKGTLQEGLPMEFFGQDVIEGMKIGARK